jgi:DsbC/DsbD-like thiol-disulfide interchange protein
VGEVHEINLDLNWLACSNVCVPEKAPVKTSVRVGPPGSAETLPYTIERFAAARASLPKKVDSLEGVTDAGAVGNDSFRASVKDGQLLITAKSADRLVFMPASTGAPLANALVEGEVKGETLRAAIGESDAKFISGIVQIWKGKTQENYRIELPLLVPQGNAPASKIVEPRTPPQIP